VTRDRCYDFKKYFRRKILVPAFFAQNAKFSPKIGKIAKNCDHSIDPRLVEFSFHLMGWARSEKKTIVR
jgi:hypothetical protein